MAVRADASATLVSDPTPPGAAARALLARGLAGILGRYRIPPEDRDDLVQEAYLALLRRRERIADPAAWLRGALRVACLRYRRALAYRRYEAVDAHLLDAFHDPTLPEVERRRLMAEVDAALGRLRGRCREVLRCRYGLGCDRFETAARLGCRPGSVGSLEKRCLAALATALHLGATHPG